MAEEPDTVKAPGGVELGVFRLQILYQSNRCYVTVTGGGVANKGTGRVVPLGEFQLDDDERIEKLAIRLQKLAEDAVSRALGIITGNKEAVKEKKILFSGKV